MSRPDEHAEMQWAELRKLDKELEMMRKWGVSETDPGYQSLWKARGAAMGKLGMRVPRLTTLVETLPGMSPGVIRLWADAELGWMTEARVEPGAHRYTNTLATRSLRR